MFAVMFPLPKQPVASHTLSRVLRDTPKGHIPLGKNALGDNDANRWAAL
jgi:hypothetical protein